MWDKDTKKPPQKPEAELLVELNQPKSTNQTLSLNLFVRNLCGDRFLFFCSTICFKSFSCFRNLSFFYIFFKDDVISSVKGICST